VRSLLISFALCAGPLTILSAQVREPIAPGMELRLRARGVSGRVQGRFLGLRSDTVFVARTGDTVAVQTDSVRRVEVNFRGGFRHEAALRGAMTGLGVGAALAVMMTTGEANYAGTELAATVGIYTALGYLAGGSGTNGRRGAIIGAVVGTPIGIAIAMANYTPCAPNAFLCFGPDFQAMMGFLVGASIGGTIGMLAGALIPGDHWERVAKNRLGFTLAPGTDGGMSLGATVRF